MKSFRGVAMGGSVEREFADHGRALGDIRVEAYLTAMQFDK
jgi:hypothetical protein